MINAVRKCEASSDCVDEKEMGRGVHNYSGRLIKMVLIYVERFPFHSRALLDIDDADVFTAA